MNKNKGIIGVGLILAIILGIVVVGGGAYYLGSSKKIVNNPENILPNNQNQNLPVDNSQQVNVANTTTPTVVTECSSTSPSTIKVLSPNGGETYTAGQKITVKWSSCNVDKNTTAIFLMKHDPSSSLPYTQAQGINDHSILSLDVSDLTKVVSGIRTQEITLPKNSNSSFVSGQYYIELNGNGDATNIGSGYGPGDFSDGLFTINSAATEMSTISKNGITVTIPKEGFTYDTIVAHAAGTSAVALNVGYNNKIVVSIYKWNNQSLFTESIPNGANYQAVDMNYSINNMPAQYYKFSEGGESFIVVPSKLTIIQVSNVSYIGITQSVLDQIITSIKIN